MSLTIDLIIEEKVTKEKTGVFIRENGSTGELTIEEISEKYPDSDIQQYDIETNVVYNCNITHNLNVMADKVGIYEALW